LSQQAQSLTLATIDAGASILLHTAQRVLAAPYHRNVEGNKEAIEVLLAEPALAQTRVKRAGVRFVAICPLAADAKVLAAMAPTGLAARLMGDEAFDWLAPLHEQGASLKIFEVR
jgi:crotonobetainyl-CoA:carnitine CoA-transferase CaiB-like acyl-CoA transferase